MLSYPIGEAEVLLESKLKAAKTSLSNCEEDLDFLREQITVIHTYALQNAFVALLTTDRLWKWQSLGYITGMLCTSARRRKKKRSKKGRAPKLLQEAELYSPGQGQGLNYPRLAPTIRLFRCAPHAGNPAEVPTCRSKTNPGMACILRELRHSKGHLLVLSALIDRCSMTSRL